MDFSVKTLLLLLTLLLSACTQPDPPSINLYRAVHTGDLDQIKRHIRYAADLDLPDPQGRTALHVAAEQGRMVIAELLVKNGADLEIRDPNGRTPLESALVHGKTKLAEVLLNSGAKMQAQEQLFAAIQAGADFRDLFDFLVRHGADVNAPGRDGDTPLIAAVKQGNRLLVKRLVDKGADVNQATGDGITPLGLATQTGNQDVVRLLQRFGAAQSP